MIPDPVCWGWPTGIPAEEAARQQLFAYAERIGCTPEEAQVLWDLERAAATISGEAALADWQAGRCAICGRTGDLVCDHDHATGLVRGWLCRSCNTLEGLHQGDDTIFARYRERPPAAILGLEIRYLDPITGECAQPQRARAVNWADKWTDAASEDIGL